MQEKTQPRDAVEGQERIAVAQQGPLLVGTKDSIPPGLRLVLVKRV